MHSYPPGQILPSRRHRTRLGAANRQRTRRLSTCYTRTHETERRNALHMENRTQDEELKAHLLTTNQEFRTLAEQHAQLKRQIEAIESKPHVTEEDELEEQRLKKLKLHIKDE